MYLRSLRARQNALSLANELVRAASRDSTSEDEIISIVSSFVDNSNMSCSMSGIQTMTELSNELAEELQAGSNPCVTTGFSKLDKFFEGGFAPGSLIILSGRPGHGKTSIACHMMRMAASDGIPAVMFSFEQTNIEIFKKLMLSTGHIHPEQIAKGYVEWEEYEEGVKVLIQHPIMLDESCRSLDDLSHRIANLNRKGKCGVAFIDYLGLIPTRTRDSMTKSQAIGEITHQLKNLARTLRIPIILLCQLNREKAKQNRAPVLTDLRDSGDIEQDADKVLMIDRNETSEGPLVDIWIRKNRQGRGGNVRIQLRSNETYSCFEQQ
ncbi:MAG: DnaB-like helicase C-terminal domain-containing protein [Bacteroidales bacterium]|nr:DnaB-like helicase C-terminal domain-containing protein [Bacteroidales bacterium]